MKKLFVIVFLFIQCDQINSQSVYQVVGMSTDYMYQEASLRNTALFDKQEIKAKNIKSCTIIKTWMYGDKSKKVIDTLYIFDFDKTGNIKREIRFRNWGGLGKDTVYWPISELEYYTRIDSTVEKQDNQITVSKYFIWAFIPESEEADTGYIQKYVYDNKNRLLHFKMNGTVDYHMIYFCGTGITHDKHYKYDDKDRMIFYQAYIREYATFRYQKDRCQIRVHDKKANKVSRKYYVRFKINGESILEDEGYGGQKLILTRMNTNSNLFSHISDTQNGKYTSTDNYILIYDYFDQLPGIKNPGLTKR